MPFFKYTCSACGHRGERLVCTSADKKCQRCDETIELEREVTSPFKVNIPKEFIPYNDPVLGYVSSRRARLQTIKEMGLIEYGGEDPANIEKMARENRTRLVQKQIDEHDDILDMALTRAEQGVPTERILKEIDDNA